MMPHDVCPVHTVIVREPSKPKPEWNRHTQSADSETQQLCRRDLALDHLEVASACAPLVVKHGKGVVARMQPVPIVNEAMKAQLSQLGIELVERNLKLH